MNRILKKVPSQQALWLTMLALFVLMILECTDP